MRTGLSYRFTHTISRTPGNSIADGLRDGDGPNPDAAVFRAEHAAYLKALGEAGVETTCLDQLEAYPDSVFVEDPALCLPEGAIVLRPGTESRTGEGGEIRPSLEQHFDKIVALQGPGFVDGGDIMVTDREVLVGLSARTDEQGYEELKAILDEWGYPSRMVRTPPSILHFKTASSILGENLVLCTQAMADSGVFDDYDIVLTAPGEDAAANAIRVNDTVFLSKGNPKTAERLAEALPDVKIVELATSQAARVDGGLSCMSLRFARL